ncbi:MAG TPA: zinc-ribbon domain-containing protein [Polyangiaceae bacterium]|jgi:predicted Zn finger-like uncharacterized protein
MRVVCGACATKYEIRDERVLGRIVKIRCKRCGEVIVVDGVEAPRTGERNEASVLFSLAMLTQQAPAPPPPAPSAADDISHLIASGPFASPLDPPVVAASSDEPAPRPTWPLVSAIAAGLVFASAIPTAALYATRSRAPAAPPKVVAMATETKTEAETATATATATVTATATATVPVVHKLVATPTIPTASSCCPGESPAACAMRRSVGASCSDGPAAFDAAAARRALASVDLGTCKTSGGPSGSGHARITFSPDGSVASASVDPPYAGTAAGGCVAARYRSVRVPAFSDGPLTVGKSFLLK